MAREAFSTSLEGLVPSRPNGRNLPKFFTSTIFSLILLLLFMTVYAQSTSTEAVAEHAFAVDNGHHLPWYDWTQNDYGPRGEKWIVDSGCSSHMSRLRRHFGKLSPTNTLVHLADDHQCRASGRGNATARVRLAHGKTKLFGINDCLLVPELQHNLLSVRQLDTEGYQVVFYNGRCTIGRGNTVCATATMEGGQYYLDTVPSKAPPDRWHGANQADFGPSNSSELWHARMGHVHAPAMKHAVKNNNISGVHLSAKPFFCKTCATVKIHKSKFQKGAVTRPDRPFDLIYSDLAGPVSTPSIGGSRYLMCFIDGCSRYVYTYCIALKSDAFDTYVGFESLHAGDYGGIGALRTDNGGEYTSTAFKEYLVRGGTFAQRTTPYTPQQNGVAERMNRTIFEMANALMVYANMPAKFWAEAVNTAGYLRNRCPNATLDGKTPFEALTGSVPDLSHTRIFGCEAYALIPGHRKKFEPRGTRCVFVGYATESKCYRLWSLETNKIIHRRDVRFNETCFPFKTAGSELAPLIPPSAH
jgi:hypothetical protein